MVARWPGIELTLDQRRGLVLDGELVALPLRASMEKVDLQNGICDWPSDVDYRCLVRQLSCFNIDGALPVCPFCAGVAFYQGSLFTRSDIETGWQAYLLCRGVSNCLEEVTHPILTTLWANLGMPVGFWPGVAVQLRPTGEAASKEDTIDIVSTFSSLWRSPNSPADQNILSIAVSSSQRLCLAGRPVADLGITVFFCEQIGKHALTSRTRVGRYLDDQPAHAPRAHIFGTVSEEFKLIPQGYLEESHGSESCPFCGLVGTAFRSVALQIKSLEDTSSELQPFQGTLWLCMSNVHVWGWRLRKVSIHMTED